MSTLTLTLTLVMCQIAPPIMCPAATGLMAMPEPLPPSLTTCEYLSSMNRVNARSTSSRSNSSKGSVAWRAAFSYL